MTVKLAEQLEKIRVNARDNKNTDLRVVSKMEIGKHIRQGDVYVKRVSKPKDMKAFEEINDRQLAPGNTRGSRHIVTSDCTVYRFKNGRDALQGPLLHAENDLMIEHPEHAHFKLPGNSWYQVTYQKDERAEERRRVQD